jgi:hypothetical protein
VTRARHVIVSAGLVQACRWRWWLLFVMVAAINWAGLFTGSSPVWRTVDALCAGVFTALCLGPVILWVRGAHPRQLRDHPEEHL